MHPRASLFLLAWCITFIVPFVSANNEKSIFLAPHASRNLNQNSGLSNINLPVLTPSNWTLRTHLQASFPTSTRPWGEQSWFFLDHLNQHQRYELPFSLVFDAGYFYEGRKLNVHLFKQPSEFKLQVLTIEEVGDSLDLKVALRDYSYSRNHGIKNLHVEENRSALFLRIFTAADYFSTNETLMNNVPPVKVDIILDPYILNVLPRSLKWSTVYILGLAILAWFLSSSVWNSLHRIAVSYQNQDTARYGHGSSNIKKTL